MFQIHQPEFQIRLLKNQNSIQNSKHTIQMYHIHQPKSQIRSTEIGLGGVIEVANRPKDNLILNNQVWSLLLTEDQKNPQTKFSLYEDTFLISEQKINCSSSGEQEMGRIWSLSQEIGKTIKFPRPSPRHWLGEGSS